MSNEKQKSIKAGRSYYPAKIVEGWIESAISEGVVKISITMLGKKGNVGNIGLDKKDLLSGIEWGMKANKVSVQVLDYARKEDDYEIEHIPHGYTLKAAVKS